MVSPNLGHYSGLCMAIAPLDCVGGKDNPTKGEVGNTQDAQQIEDNRGECLQAGAGYSNCQNTTQRTKTTIGTNSVR